MNDLLDSSLEDSKQFRFKLWIPLIWLGVFSVGYLFKILHWPFSSMIRIIGFAGFAAYNFNAVFLLKAKHIVNNVFIGLSVLWIILLFWGAFFNGGYPFNFEGLFYQAVALVLLGIIYLLINLIVYRKRKSTFN